jgi:hypothetical protein
MMWRGNIHVRASIYLVGTVAVALVGLPTSYAQAPAPPALPSTPIEQSMQAVPGASLGPKYDGVVPGGAAKNPLPAAPTGGPYLVWSGFQMTPTGSRVFLQTTRAVEFDLAEGTAKKSGKSAVSVLLRGCRIHMANNRRSVDTRFFATPIAGFSAKQRGRDVEVKVALRESASAVPHSEAGPDGTQFIVLDFPPGKATPETSALQNLADQADLAQGPQRGTDPADASVAKPARRAKGAAR